ncbi:restriction endonuclease subunit S [Vibrio parahaemolyticus]|uniref:restriction endonuclease subunit S n=1 Tax=Vibrio parahaemolyticus TaxID=670 RepID=UPI0009A92328|nr:restriction endonuclease subunit S [Vibrio parahaemolyticus]EGU6979107.1 restriction endonuclease subunit S [Vibrio parahaemolyticus]
MSRLKSPQPVLRFTQFFGDWNEKSLGEVLSLENGFAFKSEYFSKDKTDHIVLTPGSVSIDGAFQYGKGQYYKSKGRIPQKFIFKAGDIFITMTDLTPTAQTLGLPAIVPNDGVTYLHNQRLGKLVGYQGDYKFLFQLLKTSRYRKHIVSTASGTTVKHSSPQKVMASVNYFPTHSEQTKIGDFFQNVDQQIKLHQDKHNKLQQLKKAMLGKMFPKAGKTVPEVRFSGFSGEWSIALLGENARFTKGKGYSKSDLTCSGIPIILYGRLYTNYQVVISEVNTFVNTAQEAIKSKGGEVIVPASGETAEDIARASAVLQPDVILGGDLNIIYPNQNLLPGFLALVISYSSSQRELAKKAQGKSVVHVRSSDLKALQVPIPSIEEQVKISEYFQNLDNLIALKRKKIYKLQNIKQSCLGKMFV